MSKEQVETISLSEIENQIEQLERQKQELLEAKTEKMFADIGRAYCSVAGFGTVEGIKEWYLSPEATLEVKVMDFIPMLTRQDNQDLRQELNDEPEVVSVVEKKGEEAVYGLVDLAEVDNSKELTKEYLDRYSSLVNWCNSIHGTSLKTMSELLGSHPNKIYLMKKTRDDEMITKFEQEIKRLSALSRAEMLGQLIKKWFDNRVAITMSNVSAELNRYPGYVEYAVENRREKELGGILKYLSGRKAGKYDLKNEDQLAQKLDRVLKQSGKTKKAISLEMGKGNSYVSHSISNKNALGMLTTLQHLEGAKHG